MTNNLNKKISALLNIKKSMDKQCFSELLLRDIKSIQKKLPIILENVLKLTSANIDFISENECQNLIEIIINTNELEKIETIGGNEDFIGDVRRGADMLFKFLSFNNKGIELYNSLQITERWYMYSASLLFLCYSNLNHRAELLEQLLNIRNQMCVQNADVTNLNMINQLIVDIYSDVIPQQY